jgi:PTH1 family peptidyl-tRNA hydrolase
LIQAIIGLGNPGTQYAQTRHNVGFWFVDRLAEQQRASFKTESKFHGQLAKISNYWLFKSNTYMNESGRAVMAFAQFYRLTPSQLLVIHDDLDLPVGTARLKTGGGHGGHNGLRDISQQMGNEFHRLRLGIGHPGNKNQVANYVLKNPSADDQIAILQAIDQAFAVLPFILSGDLAKAMNQLHTKNHA